MDQTIGLLEKTMKTIEMIALLMMIIGGVMLLILVGILAAAL